MSGEVWEVWGAYHERERLCPEGVRHGVRVREIAHVHYARNTHTTISKDEMRALMEVASFITASPLIPCYPTNPVIATGRPDYRGR